MDNCRKNQKDSFFRLIGPLRQIPDHGNEVLEIVGIEGDVQSIRGRSNQTVQSVHIVAEAKAQSLPDSPFCVRRCKLDPLKMPQEPDSLPLSAQILRAFNDLKPDDRTDSQILLSDQPLLRGSITIRASLGGSDAAPPPRLLRR